MERNRRLQRFWRGAACAVCRIALLGFACCVAAFQAPAQTKEPAPAAKCVPQSPEVLTAQGWPETKVRRDFLENSAASEERQNSIPEDVFRESKPARSLKELRKRLETAARAGDGQAQLNLAVAALAGWGAPANAGAALYWFHAAADQGYPPAFYDLGIVYMRGCGVRQDYGEALLFFKKGALGGDSASQVNLGYFYDQGFGVTRDRAAAAFWYGKAAEAGAAVAQYNLADLYLRGEGIAQNDVAAFHWFQKAALQGHARARVMLGSMYAAGRGTPKDLLAAYTWLTASDMEGDPRCGELLRSIEPQLGSQQLTEARERAKSLGRARNSFEETAYSALNVGR